MGDRVEVAGGPWPERIGCRGVIVDEGLPHYPWTGLGRNEAVVLLDDDPLGGHHPDGWTCVMDRGDLERIQGA